MAANDIHLNVSSLQTVLIISRDAEMVSLWEDFFSQKSYRIISEATAASGLQSALAIAPALILIDFTTSDKSMREQMEICRGLRLTTNGTLVLLAPQSDKTEAVEFYRVGVDEYIPTPISPMALLIKCMTWLARQDWIVPRRQNIEAFV